MSRRACRTAVLVAAGVTPACPAGAAAIVGGEHIPTTAETYSRSGPIRTYDVAVIVLASA